MNVRNGEEIRKERRDEGVAATLACPSCDAPVHPPRALRPSEPLACPFCGRAGAVRDFLSLAQPTRPAHVWVRLAFARR